VSDPIVELTGVSRDYRGLRPLRIDNLTVGAGEQVAILGLDGLTSEVFLNLITGATVPDEGQVKLFGRATTEIADSTEWLALVDRFGIVSERAVLLDALSVVQNLSMPFTLEIEPLTESVRLRAEALAREAELPETVWARALGELDPTLRMRVRVARALALDPAIVLLEHPSAALPRPDVARIGRHVRDVAVRRGIALIAATADKEFAAAVATRVLTLDAATGRLAEKRGWFGRR
jgi:ABC-type lipoprotein export system ATPase subunit